MSDIQDPTKPEDDRPQDSKPKKPPRPMWQTMLYNAMPLLFLAVVGAIGMPIMQDMMAPPRRNLYVEPRATAPAPPPTTTPAATPNPAPAAAPTPTAPRPAAPAPSAELVRAYGAPVLSQVQREAARLAQLGAEVVRCGTRNRDWLNALQTAAGADIASHYTSFDGKPEDSINLARYAGQLYTAAAGARPTAERDCADIVTLPEFRAADTLVRSQRAGPQR